MNSREKGKRGERQWRDVLRGSGFAARRGQQFSGSADSPDVVCPALPWAHFEVKLTERLNIYAAMSQARRDCGPAGPADRPGRVPFVAHRRNFWPWLVTMDAGQFYRLVQRDLSGQWAERMTTETPANACTELAWVQCMQCEAKRLNLQETMLQALRNGDGRVVVVAHRRDPAEGWLITLTADSFFQVVRGDFKKWRRFESFAPVGRPQISGFQISDFTEGNKGNEENQFGTGRQDGPSRTGQGAPSSNKEQTE